MKKLIVLFIVLSLVTTFTLASTHFLLNNLDWSSTYSQKWGNVYFMAIIGTSGFGVAGGYISETPIREKIGFLNPIVGKSTYAIALGMNLLKNVPAAYFKYELTHTLAPFMYNIKFVAGNYGLPNFGIAFNGKAYLTLLNFSLYAREHSKLVFQTQMENFGLLDASFKKVKSSFLFTDELGGPVIFSSVGLPVKFASLDLGIGYNDKIGIDFGLSSVKNDMNGGWMIRYMKNALGSTFLLNFHQENTEITFGYNRGAVYVSLER